MPATQNFFMTGAASGIGFAITEALARAGHRVFATDIDLAALQARAAGAAWPADRIRLARLDVRDSAAWDAVFEQAARDLGPIDVSMNLPGVMRAYWVQEIPAEDLELLVDVNIKGIMFGTRTAARHMVPRKSGHIVNFGSMTGLLPVPGFSAYCGSKYAVRGFSNAAGHELRPHGVHVTLVCPDGVNTPLLSFPHIHEEQAALMFSGPALMEPEDVARVVINKVLTRKPLQVDIPWYRGMMARFAEAWPLVSRLMLPYFINKGRAVQRRRRQGGTS